MRQDKILRVARFRLPVFSLVAIAPFQGGCFSGSVAPDGGADGAASSGLDAGVAAQTATVTMTRDGGVPITPLAFGQNYWDWLYGSSSGVTGLTNTQAPVTALHLNVIRAGGNNNDTNSPMLFDTDQIDAFVAYCRTVGAEPILQVPLLANNVDGGVSTPQTAADMVTYANVTKGYGIKYWEIGNEPDLYMTDFDAGYTESDYCAAFASYAMAMRNAAATDGGAPIQILGPELSYKYTPPNDWLTPFLDGCKNYVDVVTIHRYPFSAAQTSENGALTDDNNFRSTLRSVAAIVQGHALPNTPFGVTEANISYDYDQTKYTQTSILAAPGTFYAALWTADAMGVALESNLWTLAFWNIGEESAASSVLGFILGGQPSPAYYAEQMVSANFSGSVLSPAGVPSGFSVYASYDGAKGSTAVLVLNKTMADGTLALSIDTLAVQSFDFPALSASLVQIPDDPQGATHWLRYTSDLAAASMAPQMIQ